MFAADHPFETAQEAANSWITCRWRMRCVPMSPSITRRVTSACLQHDDSSHRRRPRRNVSPPLQAEFPALQFKLFHKAVEVTSDLSDIDVMLMFGIEVRDFMLAGAPRLQWIQSLATGVDHFLRCPSLKPKRADHQRPRHSRTADARAGVYMMMAISRDAVRAVGDQKAHFWERRLWSTLHGKTA